MHPAAQPTQLQALTRGCSQAVCSIHTHQPPQLHAALAANHAHLQIWFATGSVADVSGADGREEAARGGRSGPASFRLASEVCHGVQVLVDLLQYRHGTAGRRS